MDRAQQVETPESQAGKLISRDQRLKRLIYPPSPGSGILYGRRGIKQRFPAGNARPDRIVVQALIGGEQFLHRNVDHRDSEAFFHLVVVGPAGNEPVGRLADDAETRPAKGPPCLLNPLQGQDPFLDEGGTAVDNLAGNAPLPQERQYLHGRRQGIALAGSQQVDRLSARQQLRQQGAENAFCPSGADVDETQVRGTVVAVVGSFEVVGYAEAAEKFPGHGPYRPFVVKCGGESVDRDHVFI